MLPHEQHWVCEVTDNGPGIPPDVLPHIWEPFFTTKPAGEGTGLGLSICYGIVQAHHGTLTVHSPLGAGATFRIQLPLIDVVAMLTAPDSAAPVLPQGLRVLIVEDEPAIAAFLSHVLKLANTVYVVPDGNAALDQLRTHAFDLLITDLKMPNMSGRRLFEHVQERWPHLASRTIFMSGDTSSLAAERWLENVQRPVLRKPFSLHDLAVVLRELN